MTLQFVWRTWFLLLGVFVICCLLASIWVKLPFWPMFPMSFNRFLVAYWWVALLASVAALVLISPFLIMFDKALPLWARLLLAGGSLLAPTPLCPLAYWLIRFEIPPYLERRASVRVAQP